MTAAPEDRKIRQLDNDVLAIYEKLDAISKTQGRHTGRLDELDSQLSRLTAIVDRQGNRLDELAGTQDEHSATLAEHTATLAEHGTKLDRILEILERR
jgi:ABC-type transporter Mla subunit MlaD